MFYCICYFIFNLDSGNFNTFDTCYHRKTIYTSQDCFISERKANGYNFWEFKFKTSFSFSVEFNFMSKMLSYSHFQVIKFRLNFPRLMKISYSISFQHTQFLCVKLLSKYMQILSKSNNKFYAIFDIIILLYSSRLWDLYCIHHNFPLVSAHSSPFCYII